LRDITGLPLQRSQNMTETISQRDEAAEVASGFGLVASNLRKLCGDLFVYTSSAVGELKLPALQWGSTAMPAKNNPVLIEFADGLAARAEASASLIVRYAQDGRLQLNSYTPFMLDAFLRCAADLEAALTALSLKLLPRLEADEFRVLQNLSRSAALLNALRADLPYETLKALAEGSGSIGFADERSADVVRASIVRSLSELTGLESDLIRLRLGFPQAEIIQENV